MRRLIFPFVTLAISITLAGCGIGAAAGNKPTPTPDPQKSMLAWAQCMRDHGVDVPDPGSGSGPVGLNGVDPTTMDNAQNACKSLMKGQIGKTPSAAEQAKFRDAAVKYAQCMREHGVDMPDPQFSGNGAIQRLGGNVDPTSTEFQNANKACEKLLPFRPSTSTSKSGSGDSGTGSVTSGGAH